MTPDEVAEVMDAVALPPGAALILRYPDRVGDEVLAVARAIVLDRLGPDTRLLIVTGDIEVHVLDDTRERADAQRLAAVRSLHQPDERGECKECTSRRLGPVISWPCPTALALGGVTS